MEERQLINFARPSRISTTTSSTSSAPTVAYCTPFALPAYGIITLNDSTVITLTSDAIFKPQCVGAADDIILTGTSSPSYTDFRDPFYASTIPECYALAAATVIAYMLVIMLFITPRTFLHQGAVVLGRRGFTNGPSGSDAGIGIGGRPWLQKVAALTVAISLTIATADTFRVAEDQYNQGIMDAMALQLAVEDGTELKVIRVISDTFLWLAQAQTLIRLFPRQREKIIIKWTAFALITLDSIFSILNSFVYSGNNRPRTFVDAIPALAYLFQVALSLLYAAWVMYYSLTKRQFAFYHVQMKNICLVALLSLVSVLVPAVFFVLDISKPTLAGWGDYVRWVGAAAASVVVWEWVERIEALERDDKKDGVLGREVFDGDEMHEVESTSSDLFWRDRRKRRNLVGKENGGGSNDSHSTGSGGMSWPAITGITNRYRSRSVQDIESNSISINSTSRIAQRLPRSRPPLWPTRPPPVATPINRTDTASAESTVYKIIHHPINGAPPSRMDSRTPVLSRQNSNEIVLAEGNHGDSISVLELEKDIVIKEEEQDVTTPGSEDQKKKTWQGLANVNPFKRRAHDPPPEVSAQIKRIAPIANPHEPTTSKWDLKSRLEEFASLHVEKMREKSKASTVSPTPLPVTIIPAPPRRRNLAVTLEELEIEEHESRERVTISSNSRTLVASPIESIGQDANMILQDQASPQRHSHHINDPYTPNDLSQRSIHQRGALSFIADPQHGREGYADDTVSPVSPISPVEGTSRYTPASMRGSPIETRAQGSAHSASSLPVIRIPAPARRRRADDKEEE